MVGESVIYHPVGPDVQSTRSGAQVMSAAGGDRDPLLMVPRDPSRGGRHLQRSLLLTVLSLMQVEADSHQEMRRMRTIDIEYNIQLENVR